MQRPLRLRRSQEFVRLRRSGSVWRHPFVVLSVMPNGLTHNRYGFVTGKHVGTAVARNRVRRRLREVIRHAHPALQQGYDIALIARAPIVGQPFQAVKEAVIASLCRAGLCQSPGEGSA